MYDTIHLHSLDDLSKCSTEGGHTAVAVVGFQGVDSCSVLEYSVNIFSSVRLPLESAKKADCWFNMQHFNIHKIKFYLYVVL